MTIAIRDSDDEHRPAVVDAQLVQADAPRPRRLIDATAMVRRRGVAVITTVRGHEPTQRTLAAGLTVLQGFQSWAKRAYDASTMGAYRSRWTSPADDEHGRLTPGPGWDSLPR